MSSSSTCIGTGRAKCRLGVHFAAAKSANSLHDFMQQVVNFNSWKRYTRERRRHALPCSGGGWINIRAPALRPDLRGVFSMMVQNRSGAALALRTNVPPYCFRLFLNRWQVGGASRARATSPISTISRWAVSRLARARFAHRLSRGAVHRQPHCGVHRTKLEWHAQFRFDSERPADLDALLARCRVQRRPQPTSIAARLPLGHVLDALAA